MSTSDIKRMLQLAGVKLNENADFDFGHVEPRTHKVTQIASKPGQADLPVRMINNQGDNPMVDEDDLEPMQGEEQPSDEPQTTLSQGQTVTRYVDGMPSDATVQFAGKMFVTYRDADGSTNTVPRSEFEASLNAPEADNDTPVGESEEVDEAGPSWAKQLAQQNKQRMAQDRDAQKAELVAQEEEKAARQKAALRRIATQFQNFVSDYPDGDAIYMMINAMIAKGYDDLQAARILDKAVKECLGVKSAQKYVDDFMVDYHGGDLGVTEGEVDEAAQSLDPEVQRYVDKINRMYLDSHASDWVQPGMTHEEGKEACYEGILATIAGQHIVPPELTQQVIQAVVDSWGYLGREGEDDLEEGVMDIIKRAIPPEVIERLHNLLHALGIHDSAIISGDVELTPTGYTKLAHKLSSEAMSDADAKDYCKHAIHQLAGKLEEHVPHEMDESDTHLNEFIGGEHRYSYVTDTMGNVQIADAVTGASLYLQGQDAQEFLGAIEQAGGDEDMEQQILSQYEHAMDGQLDAEGNEIGLNI
jgi:hypothetical protein